MIDALVHTKRLAAIGAEAAAAEAAGHGAVWVSETGNDPFLHSHAAAVATSTAEIGTAIAVAFARSPMTVAQTAWQLADVSGGRFRLGLGSQVKAHIERRFSMPWGRPVEQMRDFLDALSAIWESWRTGGRLQHEGPYYRHTLMAPFWVPEPHDHPIPVWLAGVGPAMLALAAERCDGVLLHPFATRAYDEAVVLPALQKGLAASGRTLDDFGVSRPVFMVMGDNEAELAERRRDACRQIAFYASTRAYQPVLDGIGYGALQPELAALAARGEWEAMADLVDGEVLDHFAAVGQPED
ncbi:MAG TPA: TIGR03617 family F420-dependent LLM class oxidoreductase, partial [Acidimicrobiia bacterium]|nr:TIGR03617 family F420-dependent LLM class oxidoreductase [Acidimicrobiia bacterium]